MTYQIIWTPEAQKDLAYWKEQNKLSRIKELIESIEVDPKSGIGKPERLKYKDKNIWSRRIDKKHRLVYMVSSEDTVYIIQCCFHYNNR